MSYLSVEIRENLHYIGVNDRQTRLFENLWPLPEGVSYNSYLLKGEKTALLDTVKITRVDLFLEKLESTLGGRDLDYLVIHHMEPDHSGAITSVMEAYPEVKLVGNKKTRDFLETYYELEKSFDFNYDEDFVEVGDGDVLDLGDTSLTFFMTPMVHWPESMVSYESSTGTLFSQDAFGSFGTLDGAIFDDEIDFNQYNDETVRYYTNIIGKVSAQVNNAIIKVSGLDIKMICPVHGLIWRKYPEEIIKLYSKLAKQETEEGVVIVYGSMYGNTENMAETVARALVEKGITQIKMYDISKTHESYILSDIWRYDGIILGSCTYNNALFPKMKDLVNRLKDQKMKNHTLGIFGSYSWAGGALRELDDFASSSNFDLVDIKPEIKGVAKIEEHQDLYELGSQMAEKLIQKRDM